MNIEYLKGKANCDFCKDKIKTDVVTIDTENVYERKIVSILAGHKENICHNFFYCCKRCEKNIAERIELALQAVEKDGWLGEELM